MKLVAPIRQRRLPGRSRRSLPARSCGEYAGRPRLDAPSASSVAGPDAAHRQAGPGDLPAAGGAAGPTRRQRGLQRGDAPGRRWGSRTASPGGGPVGPRAAQERDTVSRMGRSRWRGASGQQAERIRTSSGGNGWGPGWCWRRRWRSSRCPTATGSAVREWVLAMDRNPGYRMAAINSLSACRRATSGAAPS